nr:MAG TPA: hypothetical protein [Caudoviricetes sp.]
MVIFAWRKNICVFIWQLQKYFLSLQLSKPRTMFSNKGKMISSPELIKLRWAYFYAHIAALLQRGYGGCLLCDLALVEKSRF